MAGTKPSKTKPAAARKATEKARKNAGAARRNAGAARSDAGAGNSDAGEALTNAGAGLSDAGMALSDAGRGEENHDATAIEIPKLPRIALVAPERRQRRVEDLPTVLTKAETRLKLAWLHRATLDAALPREPAFHAHAWSALAALRGDAADGAAGEGNGAESPRVQAALGALLEELATLRSIVEYTTRPGHAARDALKFSTPLRPTRALVDLAAEILAGARRVQPQFPALTDDVIAAAEAARAAAADAVARAQAASVKADVARLNDADGQQLALDVLLDLLDHLRAAARARLYKSRPKLAEALMAPLERPSRAKGDDDEPAPAPPEPPRPPEG